MITACDLCPKGKDCKMVRVICPVYMNFKATRISPQDPKTVNSLAKEDSG